MSNYISTLPLYKLYKRGFKYSLKDEGYIYTFPVVSYKRYPTIFCKITVRDIDDQVDIDVVHPDGERWALYYNRKFGNTKNYIEGIDKKIHSKMNKLGFIKKDKRSNKDK